MIDALTALSCDAPDTNTNAPQPPTAIQPVEPEVYAIEATEQRLARQDECLQAFCKSAADVDAINHKLKLSTHWCNHRWVCLR
jgi:hypothetical protein